jgi:hypothetical protein
VLLLLLELLKNNILTHSLTYQSENKNISSKTTTIHKFFHPKKNQITLHSCNNSINSLALATICPTTHIQKRDGESNQSIEKRFAIAELERSPAIAELKTLIKASRNKHR